MMDYKLVDYYNLENKQEDYCDLQLDDFVILDMMGEVQLVLMD